MRKHAFLLPVMALACTKGQPRERPAGVPASEPAALSGRTPPAPIAPPTANSVSGRIILPAARRKDVKQGDTLFIMVRQAGGPPGQGIMLGVQRHQVGEFPMPFSVSEKDAMIPDTPFTGEVSITVRVDRDGEALTRQKGDVFGQVDRIKVGSMGVTVYLDRVQTDDVTVGAGPAGASASAAPPLEVPAPPPGHP